jgi:predicted DNA-binding transcriptional regulator
VSKDPRELNMTLLETELKGKTLIVYWFLLQQPTRTVGVRQVQRSLSFSSPSIAVHHLEKLQDLGLVQKLGTGEYVLTEEVKIGILKFFTRTGRFLVPRYFFYSVLFSTMLMSYLTLSFLSQVMPSFYVLMFGLIGTIIFWIETVRLWKAKPF